MQCTAMTAQAGNKTLMSAIAEFIRTSASLGDQPALEEQDRLAAAFDSLRAWTAPASSLGESVAAMRLALEEFRLEQEADGLARPMLEAALGFLEDAAASFRPLPTKRWTRRPTLRRAA